MGYPASVVREVHGAWTRRVVKAAGGIAAVCGVLVLAAGQVSASAGIVVTVINDQNRADHIEGMTYSVPVATFVDSTACSTSCQPATDYTSSVQWGDNTTNSSCPSSSCAIAFVSQSGAAGTYSVTATHVYSDEFNCPPPASPCGFPVRVQVTDVADSATSGTPVPGMIAVEDQPFVAGTPAYSFPAVVNQAFSGQIGFFQDGNELAQPLDQNGTQPEYTVSIDWGDGSAVDTTSGSTAIAGCGTAPGLGAGTGCQMGVSGGPHTYAATGTYTINIQISDGADLRSLGCVAPTTPCANPFTSTVTVGAATCAGDTGGTHFYTLDGFGGIHPDGVAANATASGYWQNWDIARGISLLTDGSGGYVMDGYGGLHPFSVGSCAVPANVSNEAYWAGQNNVRGIALAPWATAAAPAGYTVDLHGGVHAFGNAPAINNAPYWKNLDIIRGITILPDSTLGSVGGYTLDAYGGVHPFGNAPAVVTPAYFGGVDIARGIVMLPTATHALPAGYTLDGHGGVHPFGSAPAVIAKAYWNGADVARAIILLPGSNGTSAGGYVMDLYGGPHPFGTASTLANGTYAYWANWAIARGLGEVGEGSSVRKV